MVYLIVGALLFVGGALIGLLIGRAQGRRLPYYRFKQRTPKSTFRRTVTALTTLALCLGILVVSVGVDKPRAWAHLPAAAPAPATMITTTTAPTPTTTVTVPTSAPKPPAPATTVPPAPTVPNPGTTHPVPPETAKPAVVRLIVTVDGLWVRHATTRIGNRPVGWLGTGQTVKAVKLVKGQDPYHDGHDMWWQLAGGPHSQPRYVWAGGVELG